MNKQKSTTKLSKKAAEITKEIMRLRDSNFLKLSRYNNWQSQIDIDTILKQSISPSCDIEKQIFAEYAKFQSKDSVSEIRQEFSEMFDEFNLSEKESNALFESFSSLRAKEEEEKAFVDDAQAFNKKFFRSRFFKNQSSEFHDSVYTILNEEDDNKTTKSKIKKTAKRFLLEIKRRKREIKEEMHEILS